MLMWPGSWPVASRSRDGTAGEGHKAQGRWHDAGLMVSGRLEPLSGQS